MKRRIVRLKRLTQSALSREQRALRAVAAAQREIVAQESACDRLRTFQQEYASKRHELLIGEQSARQLANMSAFVDRLQDEIRGAEEQLESLRANLDRRRSSWLNSRLRRQRLEIVLRQGEDQLRKSEDRLEQAGYDDWSSFRSGNGKISGVE